METLGNEAGAVKRKGGRLGSKITRRDFLRAAAAGAAWIALIDASGCGGSPRARAIAAPARGERPWAFRSRPDLSPPVVEVTEKANDTAPGYIFVSPQEGDTGQGGSMILDDRGQVVWFRPLPGKYGRAMNFEVQSYRGEPVLTWADTSGEYLILDGSYREIARFGAANGYRGDHHEFHISPQDTALIAVYNAGHRDLSAVGGPKNGVVVQGIVQELDIESGKVLFEWHSLEHVGIEESYGKPGEDADYPGLDYFHINSIDVDHDGNLLALDEREMKASLLREYTHPVGLRADAAGNVQVLPNGNVFVGWGRALYSSEFDHGGKLLFDTRLPEGSRSYRAYRFPWSGRLTDRPAAVAERASGGEVRVYASWNGATEVATWEVLAGSGPERLEPAGSAPRKGFETAITFRTDEPYVAVKAKDRSGRVLGASRALTLGD